MHWKPMYDNLQLLLSDMEWYDAMPTEETFAGIPNSLVIMNDMMDDVVYDSKDDESIYRKKLSSKQQCDFHDIKNIFHRGRRARTISLNTQYS